MVQCERDSVNRSPRKLCTLPYTSGFTVSSGNSQGARAGRHAAGQAGAQASTQGRRRARSLFFNPVTQVRFAYFCGGNMIGLTAPQSAPSQRPEDSMPTVSLAPVALVVTRMLEV
jgi:hypothetical protein